MHPYRTACEPPPPRMPLKSRPKGSEYPERGVEVNITRLSIIQVVLLSVVMVGCFLSESKANKHLGQVIAASMLSYAICVISLTLAFIGLALIFASQTLAIVN